MSQGSMHSMTVENRQSYQRRQQQYLERQRQEQARIARERARKAKEEREKMAALKAQIPQIEQDFVVLDKTIQQTEKQLDAVSDKLKNHNTVELRNKISKIRSQQNQLNEQLLNVNSQRADLKIDTERLNLQIKAHQQEVKSLIKNWGKVVNEAQINVELSKSVISELQNTETALSTTFQRINQSCRQIAEYEENFRLRHQQETKKLKAEGELLNAEIKLLSAHPALSVSAFMEITAMRECGYQLKGINSEADTDLWFEEQNGKKRVSLKIKDMVENEQIEWLREIHLHGFTDETPEDFAEDQIDYLALMGVSYDMIGKKPKNPPPSSLQEWKKMVENNEQKNPKKPSRREPIRSYRKKGQKN